MPSTSLLHANPLPRPLDRRELKRSEPEPAVTVTLQVTLPAGENIDAAAGLADRLHGAASAATSGAEISTTVALLVDRDKPAARLAAPPLRAVEPVERGAPLRILTDRREALLAAEAMTLTRREYDLLLFLSSHPGRVFTRPQLLRWVWGHTIISGERTVDVHVRRLRTKLADLGPTITTVRGIGYRLDDAGRVEVVSRRPAPGQPGSGVRAIGD